MNRMKSVLIGIHAILLLIISIPGIAIPITAGPQSTDDTLEAQIDQMVKEKRFDEAMRLADQLIRNKVSVHGEEHPEVARATDRLAGVYLAAQQKKKAQAEYARADAMRRKLLSRFVTVFRFYESGPGYPDYNKRTYRDRFVSSLSRYINWEINFKLPALGRKLDYELEAVWTNPDGTELTRQQRKSWIEADWTTPYTGGGWGSKVWGAWKPGRYSVAVYVDQNKIAEGSFQVQSESEAGAALPSLWGGLVPLYPGSTVLSQDALAQTTTLAHALVETSLDKASTLYFFREQLKSNGWQFDKELLCETETGGQPGNELIWGLVNLVKDPYTLTVLIPSDKKTGGTKTQADLNLIVRLSGDNLAAFVQQIPRVQAAENQLNRRFESETWRLTVKKAKIEGTVITKNYPGGGSYTFRINTPDVYLLKVTVELERLDKKPIRDSFLVAASVRDPAGNSFPCVAAGTETGDYYDYTKGQRQSLLMPVQPKDTIEYVFAVPARTAISEFVWPDLAPIRIRTE